MLVHLVVVPLLLGRLIAYLSGEEWELRHIIYGLLCSMAIFFVAYIPLMAAGASLTLLCVVYSLLVCVLCIPAVVLLIKSRMTKIGAASQEGFVPRIKKWASSLNEFCWIYLAIFVLLALMQLYYAIFFTATNQTYDDYEYIVSAVDSIDNDTINSSYILDGSYRGIYPKQSMNSWTTFTAYLAKTSGMDVPTVCHTVLAVGLLVCAYIVFYLIARFLIADSVENRLIFMDIVAVAIVFGSYSHNAISFRLLATVWQGKAVLAGIVIPFAILECARIFSAEYKKNNMILLLIISVCGITFTMLGTGLMLVLYVAMWIVMSLYRRYVVSIRYMAVCVLPAVVQVIMYVVLSYRIHGGLVT